jgi:preflagellin peptidase FlaK
VAAADALTWTRWAIVGAMLALGSALDIRQRRVPNKVWLPFLALVPVFAAVDVVRTADRSTLVLPYGVAVLLCGFFYALWWMRLYGGADAKALMVASLLAPFPVASPADARLPALPLSLDAMVDGTLLLIALPILMALWNLARGRPRFPAAFLGVRMPLGKARGAYVWPMQRVGDDGQVRWRYWQRIHGDDLAAAYDRLAAAGITEVWVTPKLPFLVPVTVGWFLAGLAGNVALSLLVHWTGR